MRILRGLGFKITVFFILFLLGLILFGSKTHNVENSPGGTAVAGLSITNNEQEDSTIKALSQTSPTSPVATTALTDQLAVPDIPLTSTSTAAVGVYEGPGMVQAHTNFEQWLGKKVPYATDYIDYKGGWQKDFIDSRVWLMEPWGRWVKASPGRKFVLGLPMLQNVNSGQFSEGARGDFDQYFISVANELVKNGLGSSIIRLGYEANCDTIGPWQATDNPEGYKAYFRHIVAVMRAVPGNSFKFDWTVCNGLQGGHALNSFDSFYPGNDVVDIIGIDIYDVKWNDTSVTPQQRWAYTVGRKMGVNELVSYARQNTKLLSFPEWGMYKPGDNFSGGGDNPYFVTKMTELFNSTSPLYQSYFDLNWGGGVLHDFPKGETLYKKVYGQ